MVGRLVLVAALFSIPYLPAPADEAKPSRGEIPKLIEKLGSPRFAEREAATRRLMLLDEITPELTAAAKVTDAEMARRAKSIIAAITKRHEKEIIAKELASIERVGFDRYVDRLVLTPGFATEQRWKALLRATELVQDRANKLGHTGTPLPQLNWADLPLLTELPLRYVQASRVLIDGHSERFSGFRSCLAVSSGSIERMTQIRDSIIVINGDLPRLSSVYNSLIICTGDVGPISILRNSVVLTTGTFDGASTTQNCLIQAKKMGRTPGGNGNVYVNLGKAPENDGGANQFVETDQSPLATLKMFAPEMMGVMFKLDKGEAVVESVAANSPLAAGGLHKGDILQAIEQSKWTSPDEFRTLLRKKSALPKTPLTIHRGGKELILNVKFDE